MSFSEIISAGIYNSDVVRPNISESKDRKTACFELDLPLEKGGISYVDNNSKAISDNMFICAKPGQIRHTKFPFKCYYIHANVCPGTVFDTLSALPDFLETENSGKYRDLFWSIIKYRNKHSEKDELMVQSEFLKLVYMLDKDANAQSKRTSLGNNSVMIVKKARKYIDEHLSEDLSLETVAEICSVSSIHFHNVFKKVTEKTLRMYVEDKRLSKAAEMLLKTDYTLTRIAYECGFSSQSYFSYVFNKKMNCTPREYVKGAYSKYEI